MESPGTRWCARKGSQSPHHVSGDVPSGYQRLMFELKLNAVLNAELSFRWGSVRSQTSTLAGTLNSDEPPAATSIVPV